MSEFRAFFRLEWNRFFRPRNIIILSCILALAFIFTLVGAQEHKEMKAKEAKFKEIEKLNFKKFSNYDIYGDEGISVQFCPGPLGILVRDMGISTELIGKIDSIVNLSIFDNFKSKSLFRGMFDGTWSFNGILYFFGSLLCLFWAAELFADKEFLRCLCTFLPRQRVFSYLVLSRLILISLCLLVYFAVIPIVFCWKQVFISWSDALHLVAFFAAAWVMLCFFFFTGLMIGVGSPQKSEVLAIIVLWFVSIFLVPGLTREYVKINTFGSIEDYRTEIEKFQVVKDFEKDCSQNSGKFSKATFHQFRQFAEYYWRNNYPQLEKLEGRLREQLAANIDRLDWLSLWLPASFYYLTGLETSSRGYSTFLDLYEYLATSKKKFVRFYIDRFYYHDPKEMVNFIKGNENLYFARGALPRFFFFGMLVNLVLSVILSLLSFILFKRCLYRGGEKGKENFSNRELKVEKGEIKVLEVEGEGYKNYLYSLLSREEYKDADTDSNFLYLPNAGNLPGDIKVKALLNFFVSISGVPGKADRKKELSATPPALDKGKKRLKELDNHDKAQLLLLAGTFKKSAFYLFFDIALGLTADFAYPFKEKMVSLKEDAAVVYLTTNDRVKVVKSNKEIPFLENPSWLSQVDYLKTMKT